MPRHIDTPLRGQMLDQPLLIQQVIAHAARYHASTQIVSRTVEGAVHRYTFGDLHRRAQKVANALQTLGIQPGDRVGTLAWNGYRHLELYYGVSGSGAVLHTVNPRLFGEQIAYIV
ncbi:MAG: long-chain fatty acid--CoA ligase, partial [Comamonadaceae bacterium]